MNVITALRGFGFAVVLALGLLVPSELNAGHGGEFYENIITVDGDADTYYPVVFSIGGGAVPYDLHISRTFGDTGPASWYLPTHKGSLVFHAQVVNTGWGGNPSVTDVLRHEWQYAPTLATARYTRHRQSYIVWLRGGGGIYRLYGNLGSIATPQIYYSRTQIYDHSQDQYDVYEEPIAVASLPVIDYYETIKAIDGKVGIGNSIPTNKLEVNGTIRAKEVIVEASPWPDYVFSEDYELLSLAEVESHIREFGRLPGVSSAVEVKGTGVSLGENQRQLLEKVEELTLHMIEINKENLEQRKRIEELESLLVR